MEENNINRNSKNKSPKSPRNKIRLSNIEENREDESLYSFPEVKSPPILARNKSKSIYHTKKQTIINKKKSHSGAKRVTLSSKNTSNLNNGIGGFILKK